MKLIKNILIIFLILIAFSYSAQAYKAYFKQKAILYVAMKDGKISQNDYDAQLKNLSYLKAFLDPKLVASVD